MTRLLITAGTALFAAACAGSTQPSSDAASAEQFERDRTAILAMAGDYEVTFHFEETVPLAAGYELKDPKDTGATEIVRVIEDSGDLIRLQHILVAQTDDGPMVIKHWRQDWAFEPTTKLDYRDFNRWVSVEVPKSEARGAWLQSVYQVDDSPRYFGVGKWVHDGGASTWESAPTWRPLPRRERTTRDDYHVLVSVNRHTITPWGWSHEQDSEKLVLGDDANTVLVREIGVNTYAKSDSFDPAPAEAYWNNTQKFWSEVRAYWDGLEAAGATVRIDDPQALFQELLTVAGQVDKGDRSSDDAESWAMGTLERLVEAEADQYAAK